MELYTTQQQLAKLQTNLDKTHDAHAALEATREQSEARSFSHRSPYDRVGVVDAVS